MKSQVGIISALLCLVFASPVANGQDTGAPLLSGVQCQRINSDDVAAPEFAVENFDKRTQAFLLCSTAEGETESDEFFAGTVPLTGDTNLSLANFTDWKANPAGSDLFVTTSEGNHPVKSFLSEILPIDASAVDSILGYTHSRPTTEMICTTETSGKPQCSIKEVEVCRVVYGRKECRWVEKEVCTDGDEPVESCHDETVIGFFRNVPQLDGFMTLKPVNYCVYGIVEKQSKTVYGRVFKERRCCESMVVDGAIKYVCSGWEAY